MVSVMLRDLHLESNHEGVEYVRSLIQQRVWILGLRNALRSTKSSCVYCRNLRVQIKSPFLSDIPADRLNYQSHPFPYIGMDYFGLFDVNL